MKREWQDREGLPWTTREPLSASPEESTDFESADVRRVARALLGCRLESDVGGVRVEVVIVETEAYLGTEDPASHAATRAPTARNQIMYGPPGVAYVYRIYGMHWCLNVVTAEVGRPQAVLIRGAWVLDGFDVAAGRRKGKAPLAAGPGRLCQALGVDDALNGHRLSDAPLRLMPGWRVPDERVEVSGRVGVRLASTWPLRYFVRGSRGVSSGPHEPADDTVQMPA